MANRFKLGDKIIVISGMSKKLKDKIGTIIYIDGEFCEVELEGRKDYDRLHYSALELLDNQDYVRLDGYSASRVQEILQRVEDNWTTEPLIKDTAERNNEEIEEAINNPVELSDEEKAFLTKPEELLEMIKARKATPVYSGVLKYFPDAIQAVARCSFIANEQHNPGTEMHWDRSKSGDELDALSRHLLDAGTMDDDDIRHSTKVAWRALANLQKELELDDRPAK